MTRIIAVAALLALTSAPAAGAIPSISRAKIIEIAKTGVGCPYVWGGTCWDPNNKSWKGADCSGYVTVTWQIPKASKTTDCLAHYYTTSTYTNSSTHWTSISRNDLIKGDAMVYNSGSAGHIILFESGDKWGSAQVYEARGTAYGIVHRTKSVESKYVARRRNSLTPDAPSYPLLTISNQITTIGGQGRDFCTLGKSTGIFDWKVGQTTEVAVDVKNSGTAPANNVSVGLWAEEPYLAVTKWNIHGNWQQGGSFVLNDTDSQQQLGHDNPGKTFKLWLGKLSVGETKRVLLKVKALKYSVGKADHPDVRAWVSHVDNYYEKSAFDATYNNVGNYQQQNGGDLRTYAQTDVLDQETCDGQDNDCDGQIDEGVCTQPQQDSGRGSGRTADGGAGDPDQESDGWPQGTLPQVDNDDQPGGALMGGCAVGGGSGAPPPLLLLLLALASVLARRRST